MTMDKIEILRVCRCQTFIGYAASGKPRGRGVPNENCRDARADGGCAGCAGCAARHTVTVLLVNAATDELTALRPPRPPPTSSSNVAIATRRVTRRRPPPVDAAPPAHLPRAAPPPPPPLAFHLQHFTPRTARPADPRVRCATCARLRYSHRLARAGRRRGHRARDPA
jgi:hypothetical protein